MHLKKTETGIKTLQKPAPYLMLRMRQISILAGRTHSRGSIQSLMQRDIGDELHWLLQNALIDEPVNAFFKVNQKPMQCGANNSIRS